MLLYFKYILRQLNTFYTEYKDWKLFENREKGCMTICNIPNIQHISEKEYIKKWSALQKKRNTPFAYRFYSHFCGHDIRIASETAARIINAKLNPPIYYGYLCDKNNFDRILPNAPFPKTLFRKMGGMFLQADYQAIKKPLLCYYQNTDKIIVKDTLNSDSGRGVKLFFKKGSNYIDKEGNDLIEYIYKQDNIIIQECLDQHPFLSQFNPTSINTIRVATYRSVKDNNSHILSMIIRLGAKNAYVDNMHSGGRMVRVLDGGILAKTCYDQYGQAATEHNGLDLSENLILPNYNDICDLVLQLSQEVPQARLIQWDIALDESGKSRIIEFNIIGFPTWVAQMTGTPAFGEYTDEIIEYVNALCKDK